MTEEQARREYLLQFIINTKYVKAIIVIDTIIEWIGDIIKRCDSEEELKSPGEADLRIIEDKINYGFMKDPIAYPLKGIELSWKATFGNPEHALDLFYHNGGNISEDLTYTTVEAMRKYIISDIVSDPMKWIDVPVVCEYAKYCAQNANLIKDPIHA